MQITIDSSKPLTALDRALIQSILDGETTSIVTEPAKKPTPAPAPKPAPKPKPEPEPEPEPEEDLIGGSEPELTVQDAIDAATVLVNAGKQQQVKEALKMVGAARVGHVSLDKVATFIAALEE